MSKHIEHFGEHPPVVTGHKSVEIIFRNRELLELYRDVSNLVHYLIGTKYEKIASKKFAKAMGDISLKVTRKRLSPEEREKIALEMLSNVKKELEEIVKFYKAEKGIFY